MSKEYDLYLKEHRGNVAKGYRWIKEHTPWLISKAFPESDLEHQICESHDSSKNEADEYKAYDKQ